jgi:hypothetical protein
MRHKVLTRGINYAYKMDCSTIGMVRKSGRLKLGLMREAEFPEIWEH